jgi:hypothetical protein
MKALESIKDLFRHRDFLGLYFGHRLFTHFGCANGFLGLYYTFFGWSFISRRGAYWQSFPLGRCTCCFGHFVLMCNLLIFLFHTDNIYFFLLVSFGRFRRKSYVNMWGHYGSKIMGVFSRPFNKASCLIIDILCGIGFFSMEYYAPLGFLGS